MKSETLAQLQAPMETQISPFPSSKYPIGLLQLLGNDSFAPSCLWHYGVWARTHEGTFRSSGVLISLCWIRSKSNKHRICIQPNLAVDWQFSIYLILP